MQIIQKLNTTKKFFIQGTKAVHYAKNIINPDEDEQRRKR